LAVIFPLLVLVFGVMIQTGMWFYGKSAALAAAEDGAGAGATLGGTRSACVTAATETASLPGKALQNFTVSCSVGSTEVTAVVKGEGPSLVPFWKPTIEQSATLPKERFTKP
jgi:Flp pilus assembly protein TadG